jgi:hypothetical protein
MHLGSLLCFLAALNEHTLTAWFWMNSVQAYAGSCFVTHLAKNCANQSNQRVRAQNAAINIMATACGKRLG